VIDVDEIETDGGMPQMDFSVLRAPDRNLLPL
jgi:hypothetical protein